MSDPHFVELFGDVTDDDIITEAGRMVGFSASFFAVAESLTTYASYTDSEVPEDFINPVKRHAIRTEAAMQARILEVFEALRDGQPIPAGAVETVILETEERDRALSDDEGCECAPTPEDPTRLPIPAPNADTPQFRGPNLFG